MIKLQSAIRFSTLTIIRVSTTIIGLVPFRPAGVARPSPKHTVVESDLASIGALRYSRSATERLCLDANRRRAHILGRHTRRGRPGTPRNAELPCSRPSPWPAPAAELAKGAPQPCLGCRPSPCLLRPPEPCLGCHPQPYLGPRSLSSAHAAAAATSQHSGAATKAQVGRRQGEQGREGLFGRDLLSLFDIIDRIGDVQRVISVRPKII